jgi:hypothetical protein
MFARGDAPVRVDLPFDPEEIRGAEGVFLIDPLVHPLPDTETDVVRYVPQQVQVEVIPLEMGVILARPYFLMESAPGIYGELVQMGFDSFQKGILCL